MSLDADGAPGGLHHDGGVLRRLVRRGPPLRVGERCEMCAAPVPDEHGHVVDVQGRGLLCVCRPCYLLFTSGGAGGDNFRAVPDRVVDLGGDAVGPQQWDRLEVPVSVAFFFHHSVLGHVVGLYPGPGGATESELALSTWGDLVTEVPALADLEPDVEALLVRQPRAQAPGEAFIVPIDTCYELTGRLRAVWQGIEGGRAVRDELDAHFRALHERSRPAGAGPR